VNVWEDVDVERFFQDIEEGIIFEDHHDAKS
jgi:hypothetical protein